MNKPLRYFVLPLTIALASLLTGLLLVPWTVAYAERLKGLYEMELLGVAAPPGSDLPPGQAGQTAILLRSKGTKRELTLFVGPFEAQSIAVPLQQLKPLRPLTHDLTISLLAAFHSHLKRVTISDFKDNIYYATLYIEADGKEIAVDSRPSDAIALALRVGVPIYASSKALDGASANRSPR